MSKEILLNIWLKQSFIRLIADQTGLEIRARDQSALITKIFLRMKALKLSSPQAYYQLLESNTIKSCQEWQNLVSLITNSESFFFRDKNQFSLLKNHILPELIQRKQNSKSIRICSAGCSTGEEAYSVAILLKELIPNSEEWNLMILGVDINSISLEKAKAGIYRSWSFRGVDTEIQQRYFRLINDQYYIDPQISKMLKFQTLNLIKDPFPQPNLELRDMDLILCRNVFIYFEEAAIGKALEKLYHTLQPLGYLLTGHAELHVQNLSQFQTNTFTESFIYQRPVDDLFNSSSASSIEPNNCLTKNSSLETKNKNQTRSEDEEKFRGNNISQFIQENKFNSSQPCKNQDSSFQLTNKILLQRAEMLLEKKAYNLAIEQLEKLLGLNPENAYAYQLMAQISINTNDFEQATYYCQKALEIDIFSVTIYYLLADISEKQGNVAEVKYILKKIIYLEPCSVAAYFRLSHIYQQEGDEKRNIKMQRSALNILKRLPPNTKILELDNLPITKLILELEARLKDY